MPPKIDLGIERDPNKKGSYRRRLDDVLVALAKLQIDKFREEGAFVFYYLACEKVARIMVGLTDKKPGASHFNKIKIRSSNVMKACASLRSGILKDEIELIFRNDKDTACRLRNQLIHDIGPTHVVQIIQNAARLNNVMKKFIQAGRKAIIDHLQ
jgi:hypothetical protein